jgi:hypothetical protein
MSLTSAGPECVKFDYLLKLSQEQIRALEIDDMPAFDRILAARRTLIESLVDTRALIESDPTLQTKVAHIQECDRSAQRLLYRKVGKIMRTLSELQQAKKARRAYYRPGPSAASGGYQIQPDTPRFLDRKS